MFWAERNNSSRCLRKIAFLGKPEGRRREKGTTATILSFHLKGAELVLQTRMAEKYER